MDEHDPSHIFGDATEQYNDWTGTAAADDADPDGALYELAGLDPERWVIVGIEINDGYVRVYAFDQRDALTPPELYAQEHGQIPVRVFQIHEGDDNVWSLRVLTQCFKRWTIHLHGFGVPTVVVHPFDPDYDPQAD